ncbi:MAG: HIT domain-containing protein [bacterium]
MEKIWAPWRMQYILSEKKSGCIFCEKAQESEDRGNYILFRDTLGFVIMNIFPYNNGHLMIAPYRHAASLEELSSEELFQIMTLTKKSVACLQEAMKADGYNIGMNVGAVAGAGIADHLHLHIVPRWCGDTNFMPVLADIKVLPQHLDTTYDILKPLFR